MTELAETAKELHASRPDPDGDGATQAQKAKIAFAMLALLANETARKTGAAHRELLSLRLLQKFALREIPPDSPGKTVVESDPAAAVVEPVLRLADELTPPDLQGEPAWVQLTALVAAETGLLPPAKGDPIRDPKMHVISQDVPRALEDVRFDLRRRRIA
jgi:hypothetical protein